jgi:hypothetical protein
VGRIAHLFLLAGAAAASSAAWAQTAFDPVRLGSSGIVLSGMVRSRLENWHWFTADSGDYAYGFSGNHVRLGLSRSGKRFDWMVELASPFLLNLPEDAVGAGAQGQLGMGGSYFLSSGGRSRNVGMVFPKQVHLRVKKLFGGELNSLRVGRFEFQDGSEVTAKNPTLGVIKRERVHQRLLGPFVFTHVMRSFDGFHLVRDTPRRNYTLIGAVPTRGVFQVDGWGWLKTAFSYASITGQTSPARGQIGEWRVFGMYYHDWRRVLKQDNRPAGVRAGDGGNVAITTWGGHYAHVVAGAGGEYDFLVDGALQHGRWGSLDHRAAMINLEAGFQPKILPRWKPWFHGGYYFGSGDRDPADRRHTTFFQMLPTPRPYARFPFFNMMNNVDRFGTFQVKPHARVTVKTEGHWLRLASRRDQWYLGGGAFQPWTFGFQARPSGGAASLATLYDVSVDVTVNGHLSLQPYFGYAKGKSVVQSLYPQGRNGRFGYLELMYRF